MSHIEINPNERDLYSNFMPVYSLNPPSLDILPQEYKSAFEDLFLKILIKVQERAHDRNTINTTFKTALNQNMEDIVFKIQWNQQPLANDIKNYLSDRLARTTKFVLMITNKNVEEAKSILAPIDPVVNEIFGENVDSMLEYVSSYYENEDLTVDIG